MSKSISTDIRLDPQALCDLCGAGDPSYPIIYKDQYRNITGGIARCSRCGLMYRNPASRTAHLADLYNAQQYDESACAWISARKRVFDRYLDEMEQWRKNNQVLDVGCGPGFFLDACKSRGWQCSGLELSASAVRYARDKFGLIIENEAFNGRKYNDNSFDVVTLWNVLDHLEHPRSTLIDIYRIIRPGGCLIVRVPNASFHLPAYIFFRNLYFIMRQNKINPAQMGNFSFTAGVLSRLIKTVGFNDIRIDNSRLVWTRTLNDEDTGGLRMLFARLVESISNGITMVTLGQYHVSPSITAVCLK